MFRQSPRRNGRNKGLKIKHALQISVLLGVSIWLLYQVHHSNDKKAISVETNINEKPRNDSSKDMFKLGRKDIRPIVMETTIKDSKEPEEHHIDEHGTTNMEMVAKTVKAMRMGYEISQKQSINGSRKCMVKTEKDHDQSDVINDNIQIGHDREQKEDGGSKESKNKDQGKQKKVKELHKQIEDVKVKVNENKSNEQKKAVVMDNIERKDKSKKENGNKMSSNPKEPLSPSKDHHQSVTEEVENESEKDDTSSRNVPSVDDESQLDSNNSNRNEKNDKGDIDSGAQDMEQIPNENKDDASVLEDEKMPL
uniref:Dentin sialophosphoprotein-like n=1 Tax=Tanacetum cinerariifolium TaxID=118510 RepID=A0A6L2L521_TANCI|nr:dentin sialophosphoprotein-like [Tanacetum cinerariifolium]